MMDFYLTRNADLELTFSSLLLDSLATLISSDAVNFFKSGDLLRRWKKITEAAGDLFGGRRNKENGHYQSV